MMSRMKQEYHEQDFGSALVIFTDGSSLGNPGPGGYGSVIVVPKLQEVIELGGNKPKTTNNEMELSAVVAALSHTTFNTMPVHVFTDSSYVINGITKWVKGWKVNGWKTKTGDPVANQSLWQNLDSLVAERERVTTISWHYVPGHVGVIGNERCDEIATSLAAGKSLVLYRGNLANYGKNLLDFSIDESLNTDKKEKKDRSGAKAFSYLSLIDGVIMRHMTWAECEARVKGKKAKFKKALSAEDELSIAQEWGVSLP
jgi:ribonuclease HI